MKGDSTRNRLLDLIRAEYEEMPGLSLTKPQAQRLWGLDAATCGTVLDALVSAHVLRCTVGKAYVLAALNR